MAVPAGESAVLGAVIGLERRTVGKRIGVRTFAIVALGAAVSWWQSPEMAWAFIASLIPLIAVVNVLSIRRDGSLDVTTSMALLTTAMLGLLVAQGWALVAAMTALILVALLASKGELRGFAHALRVEEVRGALMLGMIGLVIYPLLPIAAVDPWGLVDLREACVAVIGISGIGFLNYVFLRLWGARGIGWTGLLGGFVNSRAVAVELAMRARLNPGQFWPFAIFGILTANVATVLRNAVLLGLFAPRALRWGLPPLALMCGMGAVLAILSWRRTHETPTLHLTSPTSLKRVLWFGVVFLAIGTAGDIAQRTGGHAGFLAVTVAGGLVSNASSVVAAAVLAGQGKVQRALAAFAVVLASVTALLSDAVAVHVTGRDRQHTMRLARLTGFVALAGAGGLALELTLLHHGWHI
jgi:uncharacterized membrane protein (DUF4010 family)